MLTLSTETQLFHLASKFLQLDLRGTIMNTRKNIFSKLILLLWLSMLMISIPTASQAESATPKVYGKTIGNWGHAWWTWALKFPEETNPILTNGNVDCVAGQNGKVWFLAGTFGTNADRSCTVKQGKALFFPLFNSFPWTPEDCSDELNCRKTAAAFVEGFNAWTCDVDGLPCAFSSQIVRAQSDALPIVLEPGTIAVETFGYTPGKRAIAIADGFWVMLEPLPLGEHTVHFTATANGFNLDVTYHLTVAHIK